MAKGSRLQLVLLLLLQRMALVFAVLALVLEWMLMPVLVLSLKPTAVLLSPTPSGA